MPRHTQTVRLSEPASAHGDEINEVVVREPIGRDLVAAGAPDEMWEMRLLASCAGVPPSTLLDMPATDVLAIRRVITPFLGEREAGSTSSTATSSAPTSGATSDTSSS